MSTSKRKTITWRPGRKALGVIGILTVLLLLVATVSIALAISDPDSVSFTLEGCRNDGTITLPIGGKFVCPDSAYTTGNLGKGWNELDLVPFRITAKAGNAAPLTQTYAVSIALDNYDAGHPGYDVISSDGAGGAPALNTSLSDATCTALASTAQLTLTPGVGGIDQTIYRILTITQPKNTTCVYDWYGRLALGSHLFPGSSLHANLLNQNLGTQGIGAKDVSIPVKEILPQELSKDMSASQGTDHVWDITKSATPATLSFANTCSVNGTDAQGLQLTISWTKGPADPSGPITVITHIYATNPASRVITTNVTDVIYSGTTPLDTASSGPVDVPANIANYLILTHTYLAPFGTTNLNDIATATYTDKDTGIPVPGTTTAIAAAPVQFSGSELNQTATINDVESITGSYLTFSADSFSNATGAFDGGYVAGSETTGPVSWTSDSQSDSGSVTFGKQVYVSQPSVVTGKLSDTATLTGSDGASADSALDVNISTYALVDLTINKTIDVAQPTDTSFTFKVLDGATEVATAIVTIPAGDTSGSAIVSGLTPGVTYTIDEVDQTGWKPNANQTATINLPSCAGSVDFANTAAKDLTISKTAVPSFTRTFHWDINKDVDKTEIDIADGGTATFNYTVGVTHDAGTDSAWKVDGEITVSNPNDWLAITADVADALPGADCTVTGGTGVTVPASGSVNVPYSCTFASQPAYDTDLTNTATATWDQATYGTPSGSASYDKVFQFNDPTTIVDGSVDVSDTLGGNLGTVSYTDPNPKEFKYSHDFNGVGGTCTDYDNTATIITNDTKASDTASQTVTVCVGLDLTVSKTASGTFDRAYLWDISKDVDKTTVNIADGGKATFNYTVVVNQTGFTDSGWEVHGTITLHNPNDWEDITLDSLDDAVDNGGTCTVAAGPYVVPKSGSLDVGYSCSFASAPSSYSGTNTATAKWDAATYFTPSGSADGNANFTLAKDQTTNETVHVTDTLGGSLGSVTATDPPADPASATFTYSHDFTGVGGTCTTYDNTATITETGQEAGASVEVCVGLDLTVSKTASGTFDREYFWSISKDVDKTTVNIADGGKATFNYTVVVNQTGFTDSGWTLGGTITIVNPNDWEDITLDSLDDAVNNGGTCTVAAGPYVVPKSGSLDVGYTCSFATAPSSYSGTNTATASWDAATYFTPTGSANGTKDFTLSQAGSTNKTVHVTDTLGGNLGSLTATDSAPFASAMFTYSHDFTGVGGTCTTYDNTATITETGQEAGASVEVCVGLDLTVSKTATPYFTRTFTWGIEKLVDKTTVNLEGTDPQSATFNYTVRITHDGGTDSDWYIEGTITISNPNDWEAIDADVSDLADGGSCSVDSASVTVPANSFVDVGYSCTFASGAGGTNTATATWDAAKYYTPNGSANGSASFDFLGTPTTIVDGSVSVNDTLGGDLGTVSYTDPSPTDLTYSKTFDGVAGTCQTFDNTATFTTNDTSTTGSSSQEVTVCASVLNIIKLTQGAIDPTKDWKFSLYDGPHANDPFSSFGNALASDTSLNKSDGVLNFANYNIDPDKSYTFCETNAPAGWASIWTYNGTPITPYNPDRFPTPSYPNGQDLGNRCFDFGAGTAYAIPTGGTITFQVDNRFPGGEPRTIGFWKNWATCTGGGQQYTATKNAGYDGDPTDPAASLARIAAGYYLLDDVLNPPGITLGSFTIPASDVELSKTIKNQTVTKTGCQIAVDLLDKTNWFTDKKAANDAAYGLAAQLLAAKANITAGAKNCPALSDAVLASDALLTTISFDGTGDYLGPKVKGNDLVLRNQALDLANTLDLYNNGLLCP